MNEEYYYQYESSSNIPIKENLKGLTHPLRPSEKVAVSIEIEKRYHRCPEITYLEACIEFADEYEYDIDMIPKMISQTLLGKIEREAIDANLIRTKNCSKNWLDKWV